MIAAAILIIASIMPDSAYAYVDPNTGGYFFQVLFPIAAGVAACYLFLKNYIKKLFGKIARLFGSQGKEM
jgi:hypothetical protein